MVKAYNIDEGKFDTYNGWTNYETWCVNLWLTNDEVTEPMLRMLSQMHDVSVGYRADRIEEWVKDDRPVQDASLYSDMLGAALDAVNWREIVENHEHDDEA